MSKQHHYVATMQVLDTTSPSDMSPQDCRYFDIVSGPYRTTHDARDELLSGDDYVLKFEGCDCVAIVGYHNYDVSFVETNIAEWSPHNLDEVLSDVIYAGISTTSAASCHSTAMKESR